MNYQNRNWHAIEGPNGMCACGVRADGTVVTCGALLEAERATEQGPSVESDLRWMVLRATSQQALARDLGISPQYLCDVLKGRREISQTLARKLGYVRVVSYRPMSPAEAGGTDIAQSPDAQPGSAQMPPTSADGIVRGPTESSTSPSVDTSAQTLREALERSVAQLRHAYEQLHNHRVSRRGMREFADGLIAPQIRRMEAALSSSSPQSKYGPKI